MKQLLYLAVLFSLFFDVFSANAGDRRYDWSIPTFEIAFDLPAGKIDCFYEHIEEGGKFRFTFRVMNPATPFRSNVISVWVRDPKNALIIRFPKMRQSNMPAITAEREGWYTFCFDNTANHFGNIKVETFLAVMNPEDPFKEHRELEEEKLSNETQEAYGGMTDQVTNLHFTTARLLQQLHMKRRLENADHIDLLYYQHCVSRYSFITCCLMLMTAYFYTWSIKKMFQNSTKSGMFSTA